MCLIYHRSNFVPTAERRMGTQTSGYLKNTPETSLANHKKVQGNAFVYYRYDGGSGLSLAFSPGHSGHQKNAKMPSFQMNWRFEKCLWFPIEPLYPESTVRGCANWGITIHTSEYPLTCQDISRMTCHTHVEGCYSSRVYPWKSLFSHIGSEMDSTLVCLSIGQ